MELKSLAERCLQVILENFGQFSHAFNTTEDPILKRNFEFLQRCYSNEMMQVISKEAVVNKDYFPLLINKHLRELNLSLFDRIDGETMVRMIAEVGEGLVKVSFSLTRELHNPEPQRYADIFPHLKNVTTLSMVGVCTDEALRCIAEYCPNLVELDISLSFHVTKVGLRNYLCLRNDKNEIPNSKLQKLDLMVTKTDDGVAELVLKSFPNLEVLNYHNVACLLHKIHQEDILANNICNLRKYKLTHLDTSLCAHGGAEVVLLNFYILLCPDVSTLYFIIHNSLQLNKVAEFKKLKNVTMIYPHDFPPPSLNNFLNNRGAELVVLNLKGFSLSVENLIRNCPLLEDLSLKKITFESVDKTTNGELKFLKKLHVEKKFWSKSTRRSFNVIAFSAHKLEELSFQSCKYFTHKVRRTITYCCIHNPLKQVSFTKSWVNYSLLKSILKSSSTLKKLHVENCPMELENGDSYEGRIDRLENIAAKLKNKPIIDFNDDSDSSSSSSDSDSDSDTSTD